MARPCARKAGWCAPFYSCTYAILGVDPAKATVITRDQVQHAKPDPDLFLAAAGRLGADITASVVVGDSVCHSA